ncbi:MAG: prealbumin-like fold domain-containing protein [Eubacterium sp.]|nr:prealbumin-like fold domain-containing protein [Eubacterium sp.]
MGEDQPAGHVAGTADEDGSKGTTFVPNATTGELLICGLEDDEYIVTETQTDNGYTLLKDDIHVVITATDDADRPCGIYGTDVLGLLQNDPRYETFDGYKELEHNMLTASATVDRDEVTMEPDRSSENARVPLTVVNTKGFDLPRTGDNGVWQYSVFGVILMAAAAAVIIALIKTGKKKQKTK